MTYYLKFRIGAKIMWYVMLLYLLASCVSGLILWDEGCFLVFSVVYDFLQTSFGLIFAP
ncbi:hypothetical protein MtrunA17_Chr5g0396781 [Medicago truncatula]|uniref:Transmembrane protein n=1 Tax=Medicago truncatula TaxID=3880 RepID=A0A396HJS1_MEDTR|nr:hypothetical protein MtrunA17_Chr5g0396781 [Medicago truncatula]